MKLDKVLEDPLGLKKPRYFLLYDRLDDVSRDNTKT